ncbi:uncharacterized protein LOC126835192 [Adelges cooleyi]|uniref:uncharacterized protein LOC126835192 n=1 Tax=Adelges cooleyi TaxID=133065 RepID=UPI0021805997|nr:uncharacterized protein LOC126835192 [Adelges cooleyi]
MILLRILISFALVNVLVAEDTDEIIYKRQVYLTNKYLQYTEYNTDRDSLHQTDLMKIITNIILGQYTMVEIALMLVEPENQDVVFIEPVPETQENVAKENKSKKSHKCMLSKLKFKTAIKSPAVQTVFPVHIDLETQKDVEKKHETPEILTIKREKLWYQKNVISEIEAVIGKRCSNPTAKDNIFRYYTMTILGEGRRLAIYKDVSKLISTAVLGGNPDLKFDTSDLSYKCRLFGVRMGLHNVYNKKTFIKSALVQDETCILKDLYNIETTLKIMPDGIWEYNANDTKLNFSQYVRENLLNNVLQKS